MCIPAVLNGAERSGRQTRLVAGVGEHLVHQLGRGALRRRLPVHDDERASLEVQVEGLKPLRRLITPAFRFLPSKVGDVYAIPSCPVSHFNHTHTRARYS